MCNLNIFVLVPDLWPTDLKQNLTVQTLIYCELPKVQIREHNVSASSTARVFISGLEEKRNGKAVTGNNFTGNMTNLCFHFPSKCLKKCYLNCKPFIPITINLCIKEVYVHIMPKNLNRENLSA